MEWNFPGKHFDIPHVPESRGKKQNPSHRCGRCFNVVACALTDRPEVATISIKRSSSSAVRRPAPSVRSSRQSQTSYNLITGSPFVGQSIRRSMPGELPTGLRLTRNRLVARAVVRSTGVWCSALRKRAKPNKLEPMRHRQQRNVNLGSRVLTTDTTLRHVLYD